MTDEERKAWEELVVRGIKDIGVQVHGEYMDQVILAANAELKRLRDAVERISNDDNYKHDWAMQEFLRKAGLK